MESTVWAESGAFPLRNVPVILAPLAWPDVPADLAARAVAGAGGGESLSVVSTLAQGVSPGMTKIKLFGAVALAALLAVAAGSSVVATGGVSAGDRGLLRIAPSLLLPTPLAIPATVLASGERQLLLRFDPPAPAFAEALERLVFRIHRREVARQRALTSA